ncbi:nucleoside hydrolase [Saccharopolyspora karakumensis]|uniref:Nucleoside hydrolase n=1 Tax=Saccharopolyspora karakumensis TaxID=2530386 RepID=A0A4R5BSJ3_9PSEU|nr:nucleoside hydrolase [Saccharopolyspora karakumensis]TDD89998.1 nucleoside hydrolase [Saccharopolyspora karakumensis]
MRVPVARGATRPLIEPARDAAWVHGERGLAGVVLPESSRIPEQVHAVEMLRRELFAADEPLTIVALAPLTNIALLLRLHPGAAERIERIVFMGGTASVGNASAVAEFNIWHDPEAAHVVLNSGVPLTMYGLDVFDRILVDDDTVARMRSSDDPVARTVGDLLGYELIEPADGRIITNPVIGDAGAVCALVAPELFTFGSHPVQVELAPGLSRGQTLVDRRTRGGEDAGYRTKFPAWCSADVALEGDAEKVIALFHGTVRGQED